MGQTTVGKKAFIKIMNKPTHIIVNTVNMHTGFFQSFISKTN